MRNETLKNIIYDYTSCQRENNGEHIATITYHLIFSKTY